MRLDCKVARLVGFEPTTHRVETGYSIQLNYRRASYYKNKGGMISQPYLKNKLKENIVQNNQYKKYYS